MRQSRLFNVLRRKNFGFKIDFFPPSLSLSLSVSLASLQYLCLNCLSRSLTHTLSLCLYGAAKKSKMFLLSSLSHFIPSLLDWNVNQTRKCWKFFFAAKLEVQIKNRSPLELIWSRKTETLLKNVLAYNFFLNPPSTTISCQLKEKGFRQ